MAKNDFFKFPDGVCHSECIEIEYSDDYRRGYDDGVESFRPKFDEIKDQFMTHNADLVALIERAFLIMEEDQFFDVDDSGFWHSGLHRDMKKVIDGKPYSDRYMLQNVMIDDLTKKVKELEAEVQERDERLSSMCNPPHRGGYE